MASLSEYSNVYNTALLVLQKKGFQVWYDEQSNLYGAEKEGWDFLSESPCGLLGLVAIFEMKRPETYQEDWWREDGPDLYSNPPHAPREYLPVWGKKGSALLGRDPE
jgi:hypothetical protein